MACLLTFFAIVYGVLPHFEILSTMKGRTLDVRMNNCLLFFFFLLPWHSVSVALNRHLYGEDFSEEPMQIRSTLLLSIIRRHCCISPTGLQIL